MINSNTPPAAIVTAVVVAMLPDCIVFRTPRGRRFRIAYYMTSADAVGQTRFVVEGAFRASAADTMSAALEVKAYEDARLAEVVGRDSRNA
jgi:hypothetical protein